MKKISSLLSKYGDAIVSVCALLLFVVPLIGMFYSICFTFCYQLQVIMLLVLVVCFCLALLLIPGGRFKNDGKGGVK
jgi:hypothetical protein